MKHSTHLECLNRDGFVVIPSILSNAEIEDLRAARSKAIALTLAGKWPYVRTVHKQFPPWPLNVQEDSTSPPSIWGIQHLLHPHLPTSPAFIPSYFHPRIIAVVKELLQCTDDELLLGLYNLLIRPTNTNEDFELRWHRDGVASNATAEEELAKVDEQASQAQWNLALYDDESLIVIPGSHSRPRTEAERSAGEYETGLEGEMRVELKPGDVVFYNNNILHRGYYDVRRERVTLHGNMAHIRSGALKAESLARHGASDFVKHVDLSVLGEGEKRDRAEGMRGRIVVLGEQMREAEFVLKG